MIYDNFKEMLSNEFKKYNVTIDDKIIAIIFKVLSDLNIIG